MAPLKKTSGFYHRITISFLSFTKFDGPTYHHLSLKLGPIVKAQTIFWAHESSMGISVGWNKVLNDELQSKAKEIKMPTYLKRFCGWCSISNFFFHFFPPIHWKIKQIKVEMKGLKIATSTQNYDYADCNATAGRVPSHY